MTEAVRRVVAALVRDPDTVDDLVREALTRVLEARRRLGGSALLSYEIVTARNLVASLRRGEQRRRRHLHRLVDPGAPEAPDEEVLRREERRAAALTRLLARDRRAALAHELEGTHTQAPASDPESTPGGVSVRSPGLEPSELSRRPPSGGPSEVGAEVPRSKEGLARLVEREGVSARVAEAFRSVDRARFVPERSRSEAYRDRPVGIPEDQTTSQPSLIARMIDVAEVGPEDKVLEVGTGLGYQTALLALLAGRVVSIDRHATLTEAARRNLSDAGIDGVLLLTGDGWQGVPEHAPFDAVIVSASASEVPSALADQLSEGGRLVIPVGRPGGDEVLLFRKRAGRLVRERLVTPARFVPLVRGPLARDR